ncbi:MAG: DUF481 domain-containing protein [Gemmatimonadales bacterium]|jgi:hypothetical protein
MASRRLGVGAIVMLSFAASPLTPAPLAAQKTDVVILVNGDHVTGEIKQLSLGRLEYSTDDMGTLSIQWEKIVQITSQQYHQVETQAGLRYFGRLMPADSGYVVVGDDVVRDSLVIARIVRIDPIKVSLWDRFKGHIDFGFNYEQSNKNVTLSLGGEVNYRTRRWLNQLTFSAYFQKQEEAASTRRSSLGLLGQRFLKNRWSGFGSLSLEQNQAQSLDLRVLAGAGAGLFFKQTNHTLLNALGGPTVKNERYAGEEGSVNNVEVLLGLQYKHFRLDSPKLDLSSSLISYTGITEWGRIRIDFKFYISYEILKDFTVGIDVFDKFDSRPPANARKNDFGTELKFGWKF